MHSNQVCELAVCVFRNENVFLMEVSLDICCLVPKTKIEYTLMFRVRGVVFLLLLLLKLEVSLRSYGA